MKCPHCLESFHEQFSERHLATGQDYYWNYRFQECPECHKSIIYLIATKSSLSKELLVYPKAISRTPLSPLVEDKEVVSDFKEASLVITDSPKSSAALSRRCLQHILREKAGVKKSDLSNEIQQVLDSNSLPSDIAENLDTIRNIGNFATHPIKSTDTDKIVEVEPHEADWNLEVLEDLIDFYYVRPILAKKKREELDKKLDKAGKPPLKK